MRQLLTLTILLLSWTCCPGTTPRWEAVTAPPAGTVAIESRPDTDQLDVAVRDGYIYVGCRSRVTVKVFTILGQQICSETLPAGTHRLRMTAKGIYILKTDTATRRVTL